VKRVLVVDWDVHHGNGTQHMFEDDPSVLFFSVHRHDQASFYPNSVDGDPSMCGAGRGKGFNANVAWNSDEKGGGGGFGDADYLYAWEKVLLPLAKAFQPELTVISAGFDAARGDPLGGCDLTPQGYAHLTKQVMEVSPEGKVAGARRRVQPRRHLLELRRMRSGPQSADGGRQKEVPSSPIAESQHRARRKRRRR